MIAAALAATVAAAGDVPSVSVQEAEGSYTVAARFTVPHRAALVREVLTDYDAIARFMPGVASSRVLARTDTTARVEQEAVSKYLMFSKRVHLVLDVAERPTVITFRDVCNRSFEHYHGLWTMVEGQGVTEVRYELTAKPAFGVPAFVIRKLMRRDAHLMIEGLRAEVEARARAS